MSCVRTITAEGSFVRVDWRRGAGAGVAVDEQKVAVGGGVRPHADAALVVDVLAVEGVARAVHGLKRLGVPVPYFNQYEPGPVATEVYAGEDVGLVVFDVEAEKVDVFYAVLVE